jgi:hypothetical protein
MRAMRARCVSAVGLLFALSASLSGPLAGATATRTVLPFIADDYTRAVEEARARKVPLFIESWAPW